MAAEGRKAKRQRKRPSDNLEKEVLVLSRRKCAMCWGLGRNLNEQKGQIAHLDRDPSNNSIDNLCWLCLPHHNDYDSETSQTKRYKPKEIKHYRDELYELIDKGLWIDQEVEPQRIEFRSQLEATPYWLYRKRMAIYYATRELLRYVSTNAKIDLSAIHEHAISAEEALFVFDGDFAQYLTSIRHKAIDLHWIDRRVEYVTDQNERDALNDEERELAIWFVDQFSVLREMVASYCGTPKND